MKIGKNLESEEQVTMDLDNLLETRLFISANSGGGKSYLGRKILEESNDRVQQIIIDLEGEFITLREKYDYLLVGKEGEIPISIRTAELLARKLLELNVSAILDLSELKQHERILFVKRFLDSLINSPKELWHSLMVYIDEVHHFCSQSSQTESSSAVIDLMTRGRKRGFCGILASQRISKVNKDAIAECNNRLIGRTVLDIDRKRASEELGFNTKEQERSLRELDAGEFFAYGTAISKNSIIKLKVNEVKTRHIKVGGKGLLAPSPTPKNIERILKNLIDLPKEAEAELKTVNDMKKEIQNLRTKLTLSEKSPKEIIKIDEDATQRARKEGFNEAEQKYMAYIKPTEIHIKTLKNSIAKLIKNASELLDSKAFTIVGDLPPVQMSPHKKAEIKEIPKFIEKPQMQEVNQDDGLKLRQGVMKILNWLAGAYPNRLTKNRLATLSGFSVSGGTFNVYISELKKLAWIDGKDDFIITDLGLRYSRPIKIPSGEELLSLWMGKFRAGASKILLFIYNNYPNGVSKEQIIENTDFKSTTSGTFNVYISELRRNNLIKLEDNLYFISEEFF